MGRRTTLAVILIAIVSGPIALFVEGHVSNAYHDSGIRNAVIVFGLWALVLVVLFGPAAKVNLRIKFITIPLIINEFCP